MAQLPLEDAIPRFKANEERVDIFANGDENTDWTTSDAATVPSIRKFFKSINTEGEGWLALAEIWANQAALFSGYQIASLAAFGDDTAVTYAAGQPGTVVAGNPGYSAADGRSIVFLAADATEWHYVNQNGVKINVRGADAGQGGVFVSHAAAAASSPPVTAVRLSFLVGNTVLSVVRDPAGTAMTTADGSTWSPDGVGVSPGHFGALPGVDADASVAIQAAFNLVRASWDASNWDFNRKIDFHWETYRADSSINNTGIRQPRLTVSNGQIYSRALGKIALDCALTNGIIVDNFFIYGDRDNPPAFGWYIGRALLGAAYPGVDGMSIQGTGGAWGHFSRGCILQFAAEVSQWEDRTIWHNRSRSLAAAAVVIVDNMQTIVDEFGSAQTSDFQTLPTVASGRHSNVCHYMGQCEIRRTADFNLSVVGISKANPAVVQVAAGSLASAGLSNGDKIYISGGTMSQVAYKVFTVANINVGADTFQLSGVNSTSYTTYTGGATIQNATGPSMIVAGAKTVIANGAYLLSYGAPNILIDADNGGDIFGWNFEFQSERHTDKMITVKKTSGTAIFSQFNIRETNTSQSAATANIWVEGAGVLRIDGGELKIANMASAPSEGVMGPQAQLNLRNFDIDVPLAAALPVPSAMVEYSGRMFAADRAVRVSDHGVSLREAKSIEFSGFSTALTRAGIRWQNDSYFGYRELSGAERRFHVQDMAALAQFNAIGDRVNTSDKYAGKQVWSTSLNKPVWAVGGTAGSVWVDATGATVYTPA